MLLDGGMMERAWAERETIYLKWRAGVEDRVSHPISRRSPPVTGRSRSQPSQPKQLYNPHFPC